jgi:hypothetical protein
MPISRLYAFETEPLRTAHEFVQPRGGYVVVTPSIEAALVSAANKARLETRTLVDLRVDTQTRTSAIRDALLHLGFSDDITAQTAATSLAERLSRSMDMRSKDCLFIATVEASGDDRTVTLWTFPKDEAIALQTSRGHPTLRLLNDIFSRTSGLRKAALFKGRNLANQFLTGRVFDVLTGGGTEVADFWVTRFLDASLGITSEQGTKLLASTLTKVWAATDDTAQREQLIAGMTAIRQSPRTQWSLRDFADQYLGEALKPLFEHAAPNADGYNSEFQFSREVFDTAVQFRVFELENRIIVSTPFAEVGRSVLITELIPTTNDNQAAPIRHLTVEGNIVDERIKRSQS